MRQALKNGLDALLFVASSRSVGVTERAAELGIDKSTASRVLATLQNANMAEKQQPATRWRTSTGSRVSWRGSGTAVPIRNNRGAYVSALGASGASGRMTEAKLNHVVPLMLSAARNIHTQL